MFKVTMFYTANMFMKALKELTQKWLDGLENPTKATGNTTSPALRILLVHLGGKRDDSAGIGDLVESTQFSFLRRVQDGSKFCQCSLQRSVSPTTQSA